MAVMKRILVEPCQPYNGSPAAAEPVSVWDIIARLDLDELRGMAMALSVYKPEVFETRLMERR